MDLKGATDQELTEYLRRGDVKAFREIYDRHWMIMYTIAYRKLKSKEIAEELVQDLFTSIWKRREEIQIQSLWVTYLKSSIHYLIINYFHAFLVRKNHNRLLKQTSVTGSSVTDDDINLWDLQREMEQAIAQLPDKSRLIFELSRFEDQSNREIAQQLDLSEKAVEYHITKSLRLLREYLKDFLLITLLLLMA